jgi:hypothetical protein
MAALDFWLGDWRASWDGGTGRNQVTREVGGQVIVERFESAGDEPFSGISVSVADTTGLWRQTWADAFEWRWEFSPDADTWEQRWAIRYTRR